MNTKQKAEKFGRQIAYRYGADIISKEAALTLCNDYGYAHANQPAAQDRVSFWARNEFKQYLK